MAEEPTLRGEHTQAEIVQAAHRLFLAHGFHGTSMRQIASEAGIALGSIYNHFPSKEELFIDILVEYHPLFSVLPAMNAARGTTIEEFIRDAARRMVTGIDERMDFLNLVFIELVEFKGQHLPEILHKLYPDLLGFMQRFDQSESELRPIPMPVLVRAFLGLFFSYVMTELIIANQLPPEMQPNAFDHFVDIFLRGVLADHASAGGSGA